MEYKTKTMGGIPLLTHIHKDIQHAPIFKALEIYESNGMHFSFLGQCAYRYSKEKFVREKNVFGYTRILILKNSKNLRGNTFPFE